MRESLSNGATRTSHETGKMLYLIRDTNRICEQIMLQLYMYVKCNEIRIVCHCSTWCHHFEIMKMTLIFHAFLLYSFEISQGPCLEQLGEIPSFLLLMTALLILKGPSCEVFLQCTAISRKVVGRSARDNPERYNLWVVLSSPAVLQRNLKEWHKRPWTYVCECFKGKQQKQVPQLQCQKQHIDYIPLPFGIVACTIFATIFLGIAVYALHRICH